MDDEQDDGSGVRLYQSIYETALRNHLPRPVIDDMIRIYSYDIDFQRDIQDGVKAGGPDQQREQVGTAVVQRRGDVLG